VMTKKTNGQFTKADPRINRNGRPKTLQAARQLARQIGAELATNELGAVLGPDGNGLSRVGAILRDWSESFDIRKQEAFMLFAFGCPKQFDAAELTAKADPHVDWHTTVRIIGLPDNGRDPELVQDRLTIEG
jgi:hypothetical protein